MTVIVAFMASLILFVIGCIRLIFSGTGEIRNHDRGTAHRRRVNRGIRRQFLISGAMLAWAVSQLMSIG